LTESLNFQSAEAKLGGWFYESFGGKQLYLWISGVSFIGLLFSLVLSTVYGKAKMAS
jgi:PPP family 3-phenylpropionic acid transporter